MSVRKLGFIITLLALTATACQRGPTSAEVASSPAQPEQAAASAAVSSEASVSTTAVPAPYPSATIEIIERYATQAQALSTQLKPGADIAAAANAAESLLEIGAAIVPAFVERHPHCREYMAAALQVQGGWPQMDAATLERDFHKDGALPEVQGDAKTCYHMKDLVVHPATALVLLSQSPPDVEGANREITEVIAHSHVVRQM